MNEYPNIIQESVVKDEVLLKEIKDGSVAIFDSITDVLLKKEDREVKYFKEKNNSDIYVLERNKNKITVFIETIHSFQKNNSIKKILHYPIQSLKENKEIYLPTVFSFSIKDKESKISNEDLFKKMESLGKDGVEQVKVLKEMFKEELKSDPFYFDKRNGREEIKVTSSLSEFKKYIEVLNRLKLVKEKNDTFYKSLALDLNELVEENIGNTINDVNYLVDVCKKEKFSSKKKAFEFNDLDNHVWMKKDDLIVTDQNCGFYFKIKDNNNLTVYFLDKEYTSVEDEIKKIEDYLELNSLDEIGNVILKVENGKVVYADNQLLYILEMDLTYSTIAMQDSGYGKKESSVELRSYEYQKNYYFTQYGYSEPEFLAQAFLTLGGGFDYDEKDGILYDDRVKLLKNIKKENESGKLNRFNYCYPKKISFLNEDWLNGLKLLVNELKENKILPKVFDKKTAKESKNDAIQYFEGKIELISKKKLKIKKN